MKNQKFWTTKKCEMCQIVFEGLISRNPRFCSNKCSSNFTANDRDRIDKIKRTKLKRYGLENYVNPEKAKDTCIKKYGVDNASKSAKIIEKIKQSNLKKYGVDWAFQSTKIKQKTEENNIAKYGVKHVSQREDVKKLKILTTNKNYGVDNPFQSEKIKQEIKDNCLINYGVDHNSKRLDVRDKMRTSGCALTFNGVVGRLINVSNCKPLFNEAEYNGTHRDYQYKFECNKCNNIFTDNIDGGHLPRCQKCYPLNKSRAQTEIVAYIKEIAPDLEVVQNTRSILKSGKEIDIYMPSLKFGIEYDSFYYHGENSANKDKNYHLKKTLESNLVDVNLIHIFEDEWSNKSDIIKSIIKNKLSQSKSIGARKTKIQSVTYAEAGPFLNKHHIQGATPSKIYLGAFINNKLVGVMSFSNQRISLGKASKSKSEYELIRFATSQRIFGLGSKMIKHFISEYNPTKIDTFADLRYSSKTSNIYQKMGFSLEKETSPNYWYFKIGYPKKYHRYGFRKSILKSKLDLFDPLLSEWENMKVNGFDRIWDCGNLRYSLKIST